MRMRGAQHKCGQKAESWVDCVWRHLKFCVGLTGIIMGATKHCCYGNCKSDSRYSNREDMRDVSFIRFPKPHLNFEKCQKWIYACGRQGFSVDNIKKDTYICSLHFVDKKGPTDEHPDPIPATYTREQVRSWLTNRSKKEKMVVTMKLETDPSFMYRSFESKDTRCTSRRQHVGWVNFKRWTDNIQLNVAVRVHVFCVYKQTGCHWGSH